MSSSFEFVPMIRGFSRRVLSRVGLPTAVPDRAMPADDCRVRLPEVEPSLGASVRPGFKAPCREYCDAFSAEKKIFHHGKIILDPLLGLLTAITPLNHAGSL